MRVEPMANRAAVEAGRRILTPLGEPAMSTRTVTSKPGRSFAASAARPRAISDKSPHRAHSRSLGKLPYNASRHARQTGARASSGSGATAPELTALVTDPMPQECAGVTIARPSTELPSCGLSLIPTASTTSTNCSARGSAHDPLRGGQHSPLRVRKAEVR